MSPPSFNLVDEAWVPVEDVSGHTREVSLATTFETASDLRRIIDPSPLVTTALYRLLFAVYHRANPLVSDDAWTEAWDDLDVAGPVLPYLRKWKHRFDLFDAEAPFWQTVDMPEDKCLFPWTKLAIELPPNTSKLLFDHTLSVDPPTADAARAARAMAACQTFTVGAGRSCLGYTSHAPLAGSLAVVPEGRTLAETILANALPMTSQEDLPVWEREPLTAAAIEDQSGEAWTGIASRLTWPARAVRLIPEDDAGNVRFIRFAMGLRPDPGPADRDPWVSYRVTKEGERRPRRLDPGRMVWRDFHGMLPGASDGTEDTVLILSRLGLLENCARRPPRAWTLFVAGQAADKARVDAWRQERWGVPQPVLVDASRARAVGAAIDTAEQTYGSMRKIAWRVAVDMLTTNQDRKPDSGVVSSYVDAMPLAPTYWSALEHSFATFLLTLADDVDEAVAVWKQELADAVRTAARSTHASLGRNARALRAWARSGSRFAALAARLGSGAADTAVGVSQTRPNEGGASS